MKAWIWSGLVLMLTSCGAAQSTQGAGTPAVPAPTHPGVSRGGESALRGVLEANVKTEWESFKNKDKKTYTDLLAEDFVAVEDDGEGMRNKAKASAEIDHSVINSYNLFALGVLPLNDNAALVTYELTMLFPPKAQVRFKRVLVSELWLKRDGKWKLRYYQETHVR